MQIIGNLSSDDVVKSESSPSVGGTTVVNGQYLIPVPDGVAIELGPSSYIQPQDSGSVTGLISAALLARYPQFDNISSNFLLDVNDLLKVEVTSGGPEPTSGTVNPTPPSWAAYGPGNNGPRCQVGRAGSSPAGNAPSSVAILPRNDGATSPTYGLLMTDSEDLTPLNPSNPGTRDVMLWWEVATITTNEDIVTGYNTTSGQETPSFRRITKTDPALADLFVYVSVDDGASWYQADYLTPVDLVTPGTDLRVAFVNAGTSKIYLLGFAVLIQNLP